MRACYREWKGQRVDELVVRHSLAAANQGLLERLPEGTLVHWVVDDGSTPSPDCDDNALAGDIPKGDAFPDRPHGAADLVDLPLPGGPQTG